VSGPRCTRGTTCRPSPRQGPPPPPAPIPAAPPLPAPPAPVRRWNRASFAYTDASKAQCSPGLGCGVYLPFAALGARRHALHLPGSADTHVVPGELAAILQALQLAPRDRPLHILTHSLTSLHPVSRTARRPASLHSPLATLLPVIVDLACTRTSPTTIQKVRAHVGIFGNEIADQLANLGRSLSDVGAARVHLLAPQPATGLFLAMVLPVPPQPPARERQDPAGSCELSCPQCGSVGAVPFDALQALAASDDPDDPDSLAELPGLQRCCMAALRRAAL